MRTHKWVHDESSDEECPLERRKTTRLILSAIKFLYHYKPTENLSLLQPAISGGLYFSTKLVLEYMDLIWYRKYFYSLAEMFVCPGNKNSNGKMQSLRLIFPSCQWE